MERKVRADIKSMENTSGKRIYTLAQGQVFYETPKAYEIWHTEPLFLVKRLNRKSIGWVNTY